MLFCVVFAEFVFELFCIEPDCRMYAVELGGLVAFAVPYHALGYDRECEEVAFQLLREDRGVLPIPRDMLPEDLSYAMVMRGKPVVEPARVYCSMLRQSFYDPTTWKLLERVYNEVLQAEDRE